MKVDINLLSSKIGLCCVINGTQNLAVIPQNKQVPYCRRKSYTKCFGCSFFEMKFIFICAQGEGTTKYTPIFDNAIPMQHVKFPRPPADLYDCS